MDLVFAAFVEAQEVKDMLGLGFVPESYTLVDPLLGEFLEVFFSLLMVHAFDPL